MTIYCDVTYCGNNEDGFCLSDKLHINENGECTAVIYESSNEEDSKGGVEE